MVTYFKILARTEVVAPGWPFMALTIHTTSVLFSNIQIQMCSLRHVFCVRLIGVGLLFSFVIHAVSILTMLVSYSSSCLWRKESILLITGYGVRLSASLCAHSDAPSRGRLMAFV